MKFPATDDQESSLLSNGDQHDEEPLVKRMKRLRQKSKQAKSNRLNELKRKKDEYVALIQSTNVKLNDTLLEISQIVAELEATVRQSRQPRASNEAPQNCEPNCFSNENVDDHVMAEPEANGEKERVDEDADDRLAIVEDHVMAEPEANGEKERVAEDADDRLAIVVAEIPSFDIGIPVTQVTNPVGVDVANAISRNSPRAKRKVNPGLALRSPYTVNCRHTIVDEVDEEMSAFIWSYKKKKRVLVVDDGDCQLDIHHLNDLCGRNWISSKYVEAFVNFLNFEHLDAIPIPGDNNIHRPSKMWLQPTILWQTVSSRRSTTTNVIELFIKSHPQLRHLTVILDDVKMFFVPCVFNGHWRLFVVNMELRKLQYFDSLSNGYDEVKMQADKSLQMVDAYFDKMEKKVGATRFEVTIENVPQ